MTVKVTAPHVDEIQWGMLRLPALEPSPDGRGSLGGISPSRMSDEELQERIDNVAGVVPGLKGLGKLL